MLEWSFEYTMFLFSVSCPPQGKLKGHVMLLGDQAGAGHTRTVRKACPSIAFTTAGHICTWTAQT